MQVINNTHISFNTLYLPYFQNFNIEILDVLKYLSVILSLLTGKHQVLIDPILPLRQVSFLRPFLHRRISFVIMLPVFVSPYQLLCLFYLEILCLLNIPLLSFQINVFIVLSPVRSHISS